MIGAVEAELPEVEVDEAAQAEVDEADALDAKESERTDADVERRTAGRKAKIEDAVAARTFVLAGRARVTFVSTGTGTRYTYEVRQHDRDPKIWFVSVLTGSSNTDDYQFLGTIFGAKVGDGPAVFRHGQKSRIARGAPSAVAFGWTWSYLAKGTLPARCEVWHEGRCGKCGRVLTVPESIASGIGPVCEAKAEARAA